MECHLGRFLGRKETVHHKNHVRTDNRLENLHLTTNQSEHMTLHWSGKGRRNPELIALVKEAAADPTKNVHSLGVSPTIVGQICRDHGIKWVPCGSRGRARLLTEDSVRAALQGRSTAEAAVHLGVSYQTLYLRFGHLLTKRTSPGTLDPHREDILRLVYVDRIPRDEVARRYNVSNMCVTHSIQRWARDGLKWKGASIPPPPKRYPNGPVLDAHKEDILRALYHRQERRYEVAERYGVSGTSVTLAVRRWLAQGATLDGAVLQEEPRYRPSRERAHRKPGTVSEWRERAEAPPG